MIISVSGVPEDSISAAKWTRTLHIFLCVKACIWARSRHLRPLELLLDVVEARLGSIEAGLVHVFVKKYTVALILASSCSSTMSKILRILTLIEEAERRFIMKVGTICRAHLWFHSGLSLVSWLLEILRAKLSAFDHLRGGADLTLNLWLEDSIGLELLDLLVELDGLLEGISFLHYILVFDRDHSVVHIRWKLIFLGLLLVFKAGVSSSKWIHLVTLADLVAKGSHFIFHKLVVQIWAGARIVSDLLWNAFEEITARNWLIWRLWLTFVKIFNRLVFVKETDALLVNVARGLLVFATTARREVSTHLVVGGHILAWRGILKTGWVLERRFGNISVEQGDSVSDSSELGVNRSLNDILGFPGVTIVILRAWIVNSVKISLVLGCESISLRVEYVLALGTGLDFLKIFNNLSLLERSALDWLRNMLNGRGWSIELPDLLELSLQGFLFIWLFLGGSESKFQLGWLIFRNIYFDFVVTGAKRQLRLSLEYIIFLFLLIHFLYIDLHELIWLQGFARLDLTLYLRRLVGLWRVQNLIVKLNFVFEALTAAVEELDPFLFIAVDRDLGLLRLEGPPLLIIVQGLDHLGFLGQRRFPCINWDGI